MTAVLASLLLAGTVSCGGGGSSGASTTPPGGGTGSTGTGSTPPPNSAPVITSADAITVHSGTTASFYTATATDADNDTLTYSISGEDATRFTIDAATGALRFNAPPSVVTPADANQNNEYRIAVTASDGKARVNRNVAISVVAVPSGMRNLTSLELSREMSPGWNVGNSLEAIGGETNWGNPMVTQELMNAVKAAGFKTVRIPASWAQYADADDNISAAWMARVTEVVGYTRNAGLYAIINIHWDGGWMQPTQAQQTYVNNRLRKFWTQIATNFRNHDDYLLFAGTNEVMVDGDYGTPTVEYYTVQNSFNQTFVDAVRATGGNNAVRHLVVQGFNTNIDHAYNFATLPTDSASGRLMMEVHYYDPFNFALNENSQIWQWGSIATNPAATETWANESWVDAQFQKMRARFVDQGVPVIVGEYGAILRTEYDPAGTHRKYWDEYITRSAYQRGLVPVYWDNGYSSNHQFGLFNRATGAQAFPDVISAIVNAAK